MSNVKHVFRWTRSGRWLLAAAALAGCSSSPAEPTALPQAATTSEPALPPPPARQGCRPPSHNPVTQLALSSSRSCSLHADGKVCCWGRAWESNPPACHRPEGCAERPNPGAPPGTRTDGLAGAGALVPIDRFHTTPEELPGLTDAKQLALGERHGCALRSDGTVWCWGENLFGQLGDPERGSGAVPAPVPGLTEVVEIAAADYFSCALHRDHQVRCWGAYSRIGHVFGGRHYENGAFESDPWAAPRAVEGISPADRLAAGVRGVCAWRQGESLDCFHPADAGQLWYTQGPTRRHRFAFELKAVRELSLGSTDACALRESGEVLCWGERHGRNHELATLGNEQEHHGAALPAGEEAVGLAAGYGHQCLRTKTGALRCWGYNEHGQLGDGSRNHRSAPTPVSSLDDVRLVALGRSHSCAAVGSGAVSCWGSNLQGQLGDGTRHGQLTPVAVRYALGELAPTALQQPARGSFESDADPALFAPPRSPRACAARPGSRPPQEIRQLAAGPGHSCALLADGTVQCWGHAPLAGDGARGMGNTEYEYRPTPVEVLGVRDAEQLCVAGRYSCVRRSDGTVWCWGPSLGLDAHPLPTSWPGTGRRGLDDVKDIACEAGTLCVLRAGGRVECSATGHLRDTDVAPFIERPRLPKAAQRIWAGGARACAALPDGSLWCWSLRAKRAPRARPAQVRLSGPAAQVILGDQFGCALMGGGGVECWGEGMRGQLGLGRPGESATPIPVAGLSDVTELSSSPVATCARTRAGGLWCWGDNRNGPLGGEPFVPSPRQLPDLPPVRHGAVSRHHGCAAVAAGPVCCWGNNAQGQLGTGTRVRHPRPTAVAW